MSSIFNNGLAEKSFLSGILKQGFSPTKRMILIRLKPL